MRGYDIAWLMIIGSAVLAFLLLFAKAERMRSKFEQGCQSSCQFSVSRIMDEICYCRTPAGWEEKK